ncbi:hypothetical protein AB0D97_12590 [Streptomyces roseus]|uniref:hypothetical protein n=1 Tax=Streptomyces roseus TaxID=66430 RepID=UPI0033E87884
MIELLVLAAIAYAGARGVESVIGDNRHDTPAAREAVQKVAAGTPAETAKPKPTAPTDPGGTFSAAAPRSAALGGRVAAPLAVLTETSATMWKAIGEGYRERWPEIRAERRKKMIQRAAQRKADRAAVEAKARSDAAAAKAGPPPLIPPMPAHPPTPVTPLEPTPAAGEPEVPEPPSVPDLRVGEGRGWPGDGTAIIPTTRDPADDPAFSATAPTRRLTVVPDPTQNGDLMSSPANVIPEIRTLDGLLNALTLVRAMCEMRSEEAMAIADDDLALSNRLDQIEAEMADLEVDASTRAEIDGLRESIHTQSQAAAQYGGAAKDAADLALATAGAAHKNHGGIAEAVQSSPIEVAAQAGYYNR